MAVSPKGPGVSPEQSRVQVPPSSPQVPQESSAGGVPRRGRPKEDMLAKAERLFKEFAEVEQTHVRFFGVERKTQIKSLGRLIADLESEAQDAAEEQENSFQVAQKKVSIIMSLVKAQLRSSAFTTAFDEAVHFARMSPAVEDLPCPIWMHHMRHTQKVQLASTPLEFWKVVSPEALQEARFPSDDIQPKQLEFVAARVLDESRVDDGSIQERLRALSSPDVIKTCAMSEALSNQLHVLHMVATFDNRDRSFHDVQSAAATVQESSQQVANALCTFPAGRKLLAAAQDHAALLEKSSKRARLVGSSLAMVEAALPGDGGTCAWLAVASAWDMCDGKLDEEGVAKQPEVVDQAADVFSWPTQSVRKFVI